MSEPTHPAYPTYPGSSGHGEAAGPPPPPPPPPPPVGYAVPPAVYPSPLRGLAIGTIVVAALYTVLQVVSTVLAWQAQARYTEAGERGESAANIVTPYELTSLLWFPVLIGAYVVTCLWLFQARKNLELIGPTLTHARRRGWVWAGWVCPFVSLWFPYQVVRDVARDQRGFTTSPVVGAWWAFWLIAFALTQVSGMLVPADEVDVDSVSALGPVTTACTLVTVVALALWARVVRDVTRYLDPQAVAAPQA